MKQSKTIPTCMILGGLLAIIVFGQLVSWAGGHVGNPNDDWYYDCLGWIGTIGAFAGIGSFVWGSKLFASR